MQQEIKYTGITTVPGDYSCPDGDLAICYNLINEHGELKPIILPEPQFTCRPNEQIYYIHKNSNYENYIFRTGNKLHYAPIQQINETRHTIHDFDQTPITGISGLGNMIIILTEAGIYYAIYSDNNYTLLSNKIPELPQINIIEEQRSASRTSMWTDIKTITTTSIAGRTASQSPGNYAANEQYVLNEFYSLLFDMLDNQYKNNYFIFPFFIRFAYRLYDGSLVSHSAPRLVLSDNPPLELRSDGYTVGINHGYNVTTIWLTSYKEKKILLSIKPGINLFQWKDLITSIEIFISEPIYTLNMDAPGFDSITPIVTEYDSNRNPRDGYTEYKLKNAVTPQDIYNKMVHNSTFYKVHSIPTKDLENLTQNMEIELQGKYFRDKTLVTQESMTDDFRTHCINHAQGIYTYNNRINIFNLKTLLYNGFPASEFNITQKIPSSRNGVYTYEEHSLLNTTGETRISIYIKNTDGQTSILQSVTPGTYQIPRYFYYPESQAYKAIFTAGGRSREINLQSHTGLNGAQYINKELQPTAINQTLQNITESNTFIYATNQIKLSEVNNPLLFKPANTYSVGLGTVLALSTATKALSQGQFGQFPLYAFTTEGIWALEVSTTGTYSARQPATRDVCNNIHSIVQIDGAVAFTTEQGIMLLSGSNSQCISESLNGEPFNPQNLYGIQQLENIVGKNTFPLEIIPFKNYLQNCFISYDYPNSRILVFHPEQPYTYIYSLKSQTWTMINQTFQTVLNTYPDSYLTKSNGQVINISKKKESGYSYGLVISRPIKLDYPDLLKTITQSIHRGMFVNNHIKTILYASRDGINYRPLISSLNNKLNCNHGSPYMFFRFITISDFNQEENINGISIMYDLKFRNKLR